MTIENQLSDLSAQVANQSFQQLMEAFRNGSEEAATKIAELYSSHLLRAVRASLPKEIRSKIDSVDLVNTLWGSLLINPARFADIRDPAQLMALLAKAARNRVIDEHRKYTVCQARDIRREEQLSEQSSLDSMDKKERPKNFPPSSSQATPSSIVASKEEWRLMLTKLSSRDRKILSYRSQGQTYEEIVNSIPDVSERTARRVIASIVEQLLG